jgi:ANTAR domain
MSRMDSSEFGQLAEEFALLGVELHGPGNNDEALTRMVELAVKYVDGCSWASVLVTSGGRGKTLAASDEVPRNVDRLQSALGEGPCLSAAEDDRSYALFDVTDHERWPRFSEAVATQTPVRSVLAFELPARPSAALNLFGATPGAFDEESVVTGAIFAAHVSTAVALYEAELTAQNLNSALAASRDIGMAIGVLMSHHKVTKDAAFSMLREASQRLNRKLRDLAADVVETGVVPEATDSSADRRDR